MEINTTRLESHLHFPWDEHKHLNSLPKGTWARGTRETVASALYWMQACSAHAPDLPTALFNPENSYSDHLALLDKQSIFVGKAQGSTAYIWEQLLESSRTPGNPNDLATDHWVGLLVANFYPPLDSPKTMALMAKVVQNISTHLASRRLVWNYSLNLLDTWCYYTLEATKQMSLPDHQLATSRLAPLTNALSAARAPLVARFSKHSYTDKLLGLVNSPASPLLVSLALVASPDLPDYLWPRGVSYNPPPQVVEGLVRRPDIKRQNYQRLSNWQNELVKFILKVPPSIEPAVLTTPLQSLRALDDAGFPLHPVLVKELLAWCATRSNRHHYEALAILPSFVGTAEGTKFLSRSLDHIVLLSIMRHGRPGPVRLDCIRNYIKGHSGRFQSQPDLVFKALQSSSSPLTKAECAFFLTHPAKEIRLAAMPLVGQLKVSSPGPSL